MAYITLSKSRLRENYKYLNKLFSEQGIQWAIVSKLLCGESLFLQELIDLGIKQICDSRMTNIKRIKKLNPNIETIYIKPPSGWSIPDIVQYADISFNTEYSTLKKLSSEAGRQGKVHKVIIMVELGELREGVMRSKILTFYEKMMALPNILVVGLGTNFSCLSGVLPDYDKLNQLLLYRELISARFNKPIPYVSGGSSVVIPLITDKKLPEGINHFRVGETLYFGTDVYRSCPLPDMQHNVFRFYAGIVELKEKPLVPEGTLGNNMEGVTPEYNEEDKGKTSIRALLDVGLLDVEFAHLFPEDESVVCIGASSDMVVVDLGKNPNNYKIGDTIAFRMDYLGAFRLMNSKYIGKRVVE